MSPCLTRGADANHPASSRLRNIDSLTLGMSRVTSSGPSLVSRDFQLKLLDVQRGVVVLFHQLFGNQDRVLKVVAAPRHEGDQHIASQRQLALIGARTVGDDLALQHALALLDHRLLVDAGVLVRPLELGELINVAAHFAGELSGMMLALDADDNALGIDRIDDAVALGQNDRAGIARGNAFHPSADDRSFRSQQRNRLALHVRAHQRAVGVVVLEERHQRSGHRNQLLRADVDVVDFVAGDQHKVAGLAGIDQIADKLPLSSSSTLACAITCRSSSQAD